jgi:hypothetical protein
LLTAYSALAFKACTPTIPIPAEETKKAVDYVPVSTILYRYAIPFNYVASIVIQGKISAEVKAFEIIEHMWSFNQTIVDGQAQGATPADHPLLYEKSLLVFSILWLIANDKNAFSTLIIDPSYDITKIQIHMSALCSQTFPSIFW